MMMDQNFSQSDFNAKRCDAYIMGYCKTYSAAFAFGPCGSSKLFWHEVWEEAEDGAIAAEDAFVEWFYKKSGINIEEKKDEAK